MDTTATIHDNRCRCPISAEIKKMHVSGKFRVLVDLLYMIVSYLPSLEPFDGGRGVTDSFAG